ncbi:MAG: Thioredoxin-like domain [Bacteroidetes bacterium]|nr:Thioredoxin-like domain [Bacteroidota bacterium]
MKTIRLKPQYFVIALILLLLFCYFAGYKILDEHEMSNPDTALPEVVSPHLGDSIDKGLAMVLFYTPGSELSAYMQTRLIELKNKNKSPIRFYQIDVNRNDSLIDKYGISLTPLVLTFKNGKENQRAMGIVPLSNLEIIRDRLARLEREN